MEVLHTGLTPETLEEGLREVFSDSYKKELEPSEISSKEIFNIFSSKKHAEDFQKVSGIGRFTAVGEREVTPSEVREELAKTRFKHSTFRKAIPISFEELDDQLYADMKNSIEELGISARESQEYNRMAVIRNITTTVGSDGVALASNSHPKKSGTADNLFTGAVDLAMLKSMVNAMRLQTDYTGKKVGGTPKLFLTSAKNHDEILELTKSKLKAGTPNNDLNYFSEVFPGLQVKWNAYIGSDEGGSDTGVTLLGSRHKLNLVIRRKIQTWTNPWKTQDDIVTKFNAMYRESVGFADYIGVVHATGA